MELLLFLLKTFVRKKRGKEGLLEFIKGKMYGDLSRRFRKRVISYRGGSEELKVPHLSRDYSLYLHYPFCSSFCKYCPFSKSSDKGLMERYCLAVLAELERWSTILPLAESRLKSCYIGGGTPSIIPLRRLEQIISLLSERMGLDRESQVNIESTPTSVTADFVKCCKELGIARISIGAQSFDDKVLKEMGRNHRGTDIERAVSLVKGEGLHNNIDLLYGWSSQSEASFLKDIERAIRLEVEHISTYPLALPPKKGRFRRAPELLLKQRRMYNGARQLLLEAGYRQYSFEHYTRGPSCHYTEMMATYPAPDILPVGPGTYGWAGEYGLIRPGNVKGYIEQLEGGELPLYYYRSSLKERIGYHLFLALHLLSFESRPLLEQAEPKERKIIKTLLDYFLYFDFITLESSGTVRVKEEHYYTLSELMGDLVFFVVL